MAIFENFNVDTNAVYVLSSGPSTFSALAKLKTPAKGQFLAIVFKEDPEKKATPGRFEIVYFTEAQIKQNTTINVGSRVQGVTKGSDIFIIYDGNKDPGLRPNLLKDLTIWKTSVFSLRRSLTKDTSFGMIKSALGRTFPEFEIEVKEAEQAAKTAAALAESERSTVLAEPSIVPTIVAPPPVEVFQPAARELRAPVLPEESLQPGLSNETVSIEPQTQGAIIYRGVVKREVEQGKGFTFIEPEYRIPELDTPDAFVHVVKVPGANDFKAGQRVEFTLYFNEAKGKYQVGDAWPEGERLTREKSVNITPPAAVNLADLGKTGTSPRARDLRSFPPIAQEPANVEDKETAAPFTRRREKIPVPVPIRTPLGLVYPGGIADKDKREPEPS